MKLCEAEAWASQGQVLALSQAAGETWGFNSGLPGRKPGAGGGGVGT